MSAGEIARNIVVYGGIAAAAASLAGLPVAARALITSTRKVVDSYHSKKVENNKLEELKDVGNKDRGIGQNVDSVA